MEDDFAIAKHSIEPVHHFTNINWLKEIQNPQQLDEYESLVIKKQQNSLVKNEPGLFQNSWFLNYFVINYNVYNFTYFQLTYF